jgi:UDP-N-acetylglucosamine 2-epimerase (non-hydrolysing)
VLDHYRERIEASTVLEQLRLKPQHYILVTLHRAENVDVEQRLKIFMAALEKAAIEHDLPVIVSTHPRTRSKIASFRLKSSDRIRFMEPFGFFDFVNLEKQARCVLSDSGTVQEECCIFHVPSVTLRDTTERPETIDCGSNILSGCDERRILSSLAYALKQIPEWQAPPEYLVGNVSHVVTRILSNYYQGLPTC